MLLQAISKTIYNEIVASRRMTAARAMFKLYAVFQPGGQTERTSLLQLLVDWKPPSSSAVDMAGPIGKWIRWVVRAER